MLEPRGHDGMYGALLVEPDHPEADLAVLFMHNEGYSTMCGHATIALARWAVESGRVKGEPRRRAPAMSLRPGVANVAADGRVRFESVPSFAYALDRIAPTPTWGPVTVDIAYGGAFYAFLPPIRSASICARSPMRASSMPARRSRGRRQGRADRASRRARPRLSLRHDPDRRRRRRGSGRAATSASSPAGRSIAARPAAASPPAWRCRSARRQARLGRGASVRELHRCGLQRRSLREAPPVGPRKVGDRRSRRHRPSDGEAAFASTTTIRCARASPLGALGVVRARSAWSRSS